MRQEVILEHIRAASTPLEDRFGVFASDELRELGLSLGQRVEALFDRAEALPSTLLDREDGCYVPRVDVWPIKILDLTNRAIKENQTRQTVTTRVAEFAIPLSRLAITDLFGDASDYVDAIFEDIKFGYRKSEAFDENFRQTGLAYKFDCWTSLEVVCNDQAGFESVENSGCIQQAVEDFVVYETTDPVESVIDDYEEADGEPPAVLQNIDLLRIDKRDERYLKAFLDGKRAAYNRKGVDILEGFDIDRLEKVIDQIERDQGGK